MARVLNASAVARTDVAKTGAGSFTMTGSSQLVAPSNAARVSLILSNMGANPIFIAFGTAAIASKGLRLPINASAYLDGFTGDVNVIGTAGDVVGIIEY